MTATITDNGAYIEFAETATSKVRIGATPNLAHGRTGIEFSSDGSSFVGWEHEANFHLNTYASTFIVRTSSSAFNVMSGDVNGKVGLTFSVDTTNGYVIVNGELQTGLIKWVSPANEQTTVGAAGSASAPPATPTKYLRVKDSTGSILVIPAYAA